MSSTILKAYHLSLNMAKLKIFYSHQFGLQLKIVIRYCKRDNIMISIPRILLNVCFVLTIPVFFGCKQQKMSQVFLKINLPLIQNSFQSYCNVFVWYKIFLYIKQETFSIYLLYKC